jgi:hypothetical protein
VILSDDDRNRHVCATPGGTEDHDDPLSLGSHRHPEAGTRAIFQHGHAPRHLICATCERPIVGVAVAHRPRETPDACSIQARPPYPDAP